MYYNLDKIPEMDREVTRYEIYLVYGCGVMESPYEDGPVIETLECQEVEAWMAANYRNLMLWGTKQKRDSWESPNFSYRKAKKK